MTNFLEISTSQQKFNTSDNFDTKGRIKPLQDKAVLLPSKIAGSPIEYAKDFTNDVMNIGKAVKGKANDHELGRLNDLFLKAGSLCIAAYLFAKNPMKLGKHMQIIGFGTFFASMALWPTLIQTLVKARTGVDYQQEYIDSQGRKKYLYQDPQYVLTDLLPREDIDNIGKKLDIDENTEDRDSVIKNEARNVALQANTLNIVTAGPAAPLMAAGSCSVIEKYLSPYLLNKKIDNVKKELFALCSPVRTEEHKKILEREDKDFRKFLTTQRSKNLSEAIPDIMKKFDTLLNKLEMSGLNTLFEEELQKLAIPEEINEDFIKNTLKKDLSTLSEDKKRTLQRILSTNYKTIEEKAAAIAKVIAEADVNADVKAGKVKRNKQSGEISSRTKQITNTLNDALKKQVNALDHEKVEKISSLYNKLYGFYLQKMAMKNYKDAYTKGSESYVAMEWDKFTEKILKAMKIDTPFNTADLGKMAQGDSKTIEKKLIELVRRDDFYQIFNDLLIDVHNFDQVTTKDSINEGVLYHFKKLTQEDITTAERSNAAEKTFGDFLDGLNVSNNLKTQIKAKRNNIATDFENEIMGVKASFNRFLHSLDVIKQIDNGDFKIRIRNLLSDESVKEYNERFGTDFKRIKEYEDEFKAECKQKGIEFDYEEFGKRYKGKLGDKYYDIFKMQFTEECKKNNITFSDEKCKSAYENYIAKLETTCKEIIMKSTMSDYTQKFVNLSTKEFKVVMRALYGEEGKTILGVFKTIQLDEQAGHSENVIENGSLDKINIQRSKISHDMAETLYFEYKQSHKEVMQLLGNLDNTTTPEDERKKVGEILKELKKKLYPVTDSLAGETVENMIKNKAVNNYNTKKWRLFFGAAATTLTTLTLAAGFLIGKKQKAE